MATARTRPSRTILTMRPVVVVVVEPDRGLRPSGWAPGRSGAPASTGAWVCATTSSLVEGIGERLLDLSFDGVGRRLHRRGGRGPADRGRLGLAQRIPDGGHLRDGRHDVAVLARLQDPGHVGVFLADLLEGGRQGRWALVGVVEG